MKHKKKRITQNSELRKRIYEHHRLRPIRSPIKKSQKEHFKYSKFYIKRLSVALLLNMCFYKDPKGYKSLQEIYSTNRSFLDQSNLPLGTWEDFSPDDHTAQIIQDSDRGYKEARELFEKHVFNDNSPQGKEFQKIYKESKIKPIRAFWSYAAYTSPWQTVNYKLKQELKGLLDRPIPTKLANGKAGHLFRLKRDKKTSKTIINLMLKYDKLVEPQDELKITSIYNISDYFGFGSPDFDFHAEATKELLEDEYAGLLERYSHNLEALADTLCEIYSRPRDPRVDLKKDLLVRIPKPIREKIKEQMEAKNEADPGEKRQNCHNDKAP